MCDKVPGIDLLLQNFMLAGQVVSASVAELRVEALEESCAVSDIHVKPASFKREKSHQNCKANW